ncbi:MAG: trypsin-like peptidase domain-containing protein [Thermomicrobiales bacterium]
MLRPGNALKFVAPAFAMATAISISAAHAQMTTPAQGAQTTISEQQLNEIAAAIQLLAKRGPILPIHQSFAPTLEKVLPAVVTVKVLGEAKLPVEFPRRSGDGKVAATPKPKTEPTAAGGSGVIFDSERGLIVTNYHVVENAKAIQVGLKDGRRLLAELVGQDIGSDLAVLRVKAPKLPSIAIGDSDKVDVGDLVVAVGNPFGLEGTATSGIVSATMRGQIGHGIFEDYLQVSAPINPGNSGGALVNVNGELIGINSVTGGGAGTNVGIGFAVPVNSAKLVVKELIKTGRMQRGSTGLLVEDIPQKLINQSDGIPLRGAQVKKVLAGSAAAEAGVKPGDIVVAVGKNPVNGGAEFGMRTVMVPVGQEISMDLRSGDRKKTVTLDVRDLVLEPEKVTAPASAGDLYGAVFGNILVGNPHYNDLRGAEILSVEPGSPAYAAGFSKGDVIIGIENANVRSVSDLISRAKKAGMDFRTTLVRDGVTGWIHAKR